MVEYTLGLNVALSSDNTARCFVSMTKEMVGKSFWGRNHCIKHGKQEVEHLLKPTDASFRADAVEGETVMTPQGILTVRELPHLSEEVLHSFVYASYALVFRPKEMLVRVRIGDGVYDSEPIDYDTIGALKSAL